MPRLFEACYPTFMAVVRWLLVAVVINGLVPSFGELVETVVHRVIAGHFAHSAGDPHDQDSDTTEHGCGPTAHRCGCCASQLMVAREIAEFDIRRLLDRPRPIVSCALTAEGYFRDVFRPPIV